MKKLAIIGLTISLALGLMSCGNRDMVSRLGLTSEIKGATAKTAEINAAVYDTLDFEDKQEADFAAKGLIAAPKKLELKDAEGNVLWSQEAYAFLDETEKAPDTVNPALWENTKYNHLYGLFKVTDGIYQVRGYDMTNLTLIEGDSGWIVYDPLMSVECTKAAMQLVDKELGKKPVKAILISHSHVDHYGGIRGIADEEDLADPSLSIDGQLASGKIPVIVPEGFAEHAVSENIYSGAAMARRAGYQYGTILDKGITGSMGIGIGLGQSVGTSSYLPPTYEIKETGGTLIIDGVTLEFQITPGTEAPAEMNTWFPDKKALWLAENCTSTMHNLYTLRGAQVRDGATWAKYILESLTLYGEDVEVAFQSHNWPHWGNKVINEYMVNTAAMYKYINDQTLTYINQGYTSDEISNMIQLPEDLARHWYTRQYYGTVSHNAKAVYQKYIGWYDGNPVNLNPLAPTDSAKKWVEYLGDTDKVLKMAKEDFDAGEYQWVAEITSVLLYADPENKAARLLCADALEQLGYQSESGAWRNAYLSGAKELREGNLSGVGTKGKNSGDTVKNMTPPMIFNYMGILLDKHALAQEEFKINITMTDTEEQYLLHLKNGVLLYYEGGHADEAVLTISCPEKALLLFLSGDFDSLQKAMHAEGNTEVLKKIMKNLNQFNLNATESFNLIEP